MRPSFTILRAATPDVGKSNDNVWRGRRLQLALAGESLAAAGEYLSKAACTLPNWYSSKEGLSGESPAVFGSGGTALTQAGESLLVLKDESSSESISRAISGCVNDLLVAACALEPVDRWTSLEAAAWMMEEVQIVSE